MKVSKETHTSSGKLLSQDDIILIAKRTYSKYNGVLNPIILAKHFSMQYNNSNKLGDSFLNSITIYPDIIRHHLKSYHYSLSNQRGFVVYVVLHELSHLNQYKESHKAFNELANRDYVYFFILNNQKRIENVLNIKENITYTFINEDYKYAREAAKKYIPLNINTAYNEIMTYMTDVLKYNPPLFAFEKNKKGINEAYEVAYDSTVNHEKQSNS